jgi:hypothetical protein
MYKTLIFCDILVLFEGELMLCFFASGKIFLPKIMNDFKRMFCLPEIIKRLCSQYDRTDSHEKGFYQNVKNKKI